MLINSRLQTSSSRAVWLTAGSAASLALASVLGVIGLRASLGRAVGIPVMLGSLLALTTSSVVLYAALGEILRRAATRLSNVREEPSNASSRSDSASYAARLLPLAAAGVVLAIVPSTIVPDGGTEFSALAVVLPVVYLLVTGIVVACTTHRGIVERGRASGAGEAATRGLAARGRLVLFATCIAACGAIASALPAEDFEAWARVPIVCYAAAIGLAGGAIVGCAAARHAIGREAAP